MARRGPKIVGRRPTRHNQQQEGPQLDVRVIKSSKVSKTHKGGKTMSWSMLVVVGDNKGRIGIGMGKARGIPDAIRKGEESARKEMFDVPMIGKTIPHEVRATVGAATVILKPASPGSGVKAGSAVRQCLEAAGVHDVISKVPRQPEPTKPDPRDSQGLRSSHTARRDRFATWKGRKRARAMACQGAKGGNGQCLRSLSQEA